jgi:hypothetical protein
MQVGALAAPGILMSMRNDEPNSLMLDYDTVHIGQSWLIHADCLEWLSRVPENSIHAIVTDLSFIHKSFGLLVQS